MRGRLVGVSIGSSSFIISHLIYSYVISYFSMIQLVIDDYNYPISNKGLVGGANTRRLKHF